MLMMVAGAAYADPGVFTSCFTCFHSRCISNALGLHGVEEDGEDDRDE